MASTTPTTKLHIDRPYAHFSPSIWGDLFLSYDSTSVQIEDQIKHKKLKEEVRKMIILAIDKPLHYLDLIDAVQRSGVSYHFEKEIDEFMQKLLGIYDHFDFQVNNDDHNLYFISTFFRLLRQHGYKISVDEANMFNKFKDAQGNFKESLAMDVQGMLSLYEASKLRVHGEDVLDQALNFTTTHLTSLASNSDPFLASQVKHALRLSVRTNIPRHEARRFISAYQEDLSHSEDLLTFAKLDFNILQKMHQKELSDIQRWWKGLDVPTKWFFARDRVVEIYNWILGLYFEPEYALARKICTKVLAMTSILDDIYDSYGKFEELELFTQAFERWEIGAANNLPEYMKHCYHTLLDIYEEMEELMVVEEKSYRVVYARESMKDLIGAYFKKATWFNQNYLPTMEEYMEAGKVNSTYFMLSTTCLVGMGDIATKDVFEWMANEPKIAKATCIIGRLMNDITSDEFEQERGQWASAIQCYMKQHGVGKEEAMNEIQRQIEDAWKDINEECLYPTSAPTPILTRVLNIARVTDVVYKDADSYTFPEAGLKDVIASLLIDPIKL